MKGPQILPVVVLPATPTVAAGQLLSAFRVSKQAMSGWRIRHGFPAASRVGRRYLTDTAHVAEWLAARGVSVRWV